MPNSTPITAWRALRAGNERFVPGKPQHPSQGVERRASLAAAQTPNAVVFGCADSRVAAEIIFDQGLGDMTVVRTAGHVMGSAVLGSIEYPVTVLNVPLIVVLGHDSRGAVKATLSALDNGVAVVKVIPLGELNATHRLCDHVPMPRQTRPPLRLVLDQMRSPACTELLPPNDCAGFPK